MGRIRRAPSRRGAFVGRAEAQVVENREEAVVRDAGALVQAQLEALAEKGRQVRHLLDQLSLPIRLRGDVLEARDGCVGCLEGRHEPTRHHLEVQACHDDPSLVEQVGVQFDPRPIDFRQLPPPEVRLPRAICLHLEERGGGNGSAVGVPVVGGTKNQRTVVSVVEQVFSFQGRVVVALFGDQDEGTIPEFDKVAGVARVGEQPGLPGEAPRGSVHRSRGGRVGGVAWTAARPIGPSRTIVAPRPIGSRRTSGQSRVPRPCVSAVLLDQRAVAPARRTEEENTGTKSTHHVDKITHANAFDKARACLAADFMATVFVSHPYHLAQDPHEAVLERPYAPLSPLVLAAVLREGGHEVVWDDPTFEDDAGGFAARVARSGADQVIVAADDHSVQVKQCLAAVRRAHQQMCRAARDQGLPVLAAGPDVSDRPGDYLAGGASAAVVGDPVTAVLPWVSGATKLRGVHGERGAGGRRPNATNLDALPDPAWDLLDAEAYRARWRRRHGAWEVNVWTARGCPYRCNWCAKPTWGRSYAVRSPRRVAEELRWLRDAVGAERVWFTDDIFGLRVDWLRDYRKLVESVLGVPMPFRCQNRADLLRDDAYVAELARAGCDEVWLGAESGSDAVLSAMDKDATVADGERSVRLLQRHGVRACLFLQLGYPGETLADVEATIEMVRRLAPDAIGVSVSYPLPGTGFFERVAHARTGDSWEASMENRTLFEAPYSEAFYRAVREVLRSTWQTRTAARALRELLADPGRRRLRRVAGAAYHTARLPFVRRRMARLAVPNPHAVVLG